MELTIALLKLTEMDGWSVVNKNSILTHDSHMSEKYMIFIC